jgi:hypothetical protein
MLTLNANNDSGVTDSVGFCRIYTSIHGRDLIYSILMS